MGAISRWTIFDKQNPAATAIRNFQSRKFATGYFKSWCGKYLEIITLIARMAGGGFTEHPACLTSLAQASAVGDDSSLISQMLGDFVVLSDNTGYFAEPNCNPLIRTRTTFSRSRFASTEQTASIVSPGNRRISARYRPRRQIRGPPLRLTLFFAPIHQMVRWHVYGGASRRPRHRKTASVVYRSIAVSRGFFGLCVRQAPTS